MQSKDTTCVAIYTLSDPRTGDVRYVGSTTQILCQRLGNHRQDARYGQTQGGKVYFSECNLWVRELLDAGMDPIMDVVETVEASQRYQAEGHWIMYYRQAGAPLLNEHAIRRHNPYVKVTASREEIIARLKAGGF